MRRIKGVFFITSLAVSLACRDAVTPLTDPTTGVSDQVLIQRLIEMGYRSDMIETFKDYFVVEGDILIPKSSLVTPVDKSSTGLKGGPQFQWRDPAWVPAPDQPTPGSRWITVHNDPSMAGWADAAQSAIYEWNAATNERIHFFMTQSLPADIILIADADLPGDICAAGRTPSGGAPGNRVRINPAHDTLTFADKKLMMVHELGHTLGFRHTDVPTLPGEDEATRIGNTPLTDGASVMNTGLCGTDWAGFSDGDYWAIRTLWQPFAPYPVSVTYADGRPTISWSGDYPFGAHSGATSYAVGLVIVYQEYDDYSGTSTIYDASSEPVGTTTGLSLQDNQRSYTGSSSCFLWWSGTGSASYTYYYELFAGFPHAISSPGRRVPASVAPWTQGPYGLQMCQ